MLPLGALQAPQTAGLDWQGAIWDLSEVPETAGHMLMPPEQPTVVSCFGFCLDGSSSPLPRGLLEVEQDHLGRRPSWHRILMHIWVSPPGPGLYAERDQKGVFISFPIPWTD